MVTGFVVRVKIHAPALPTAQESVVETAFVTRRKRVEHAWGIAVLVRELVAYPMIRRAAMIQRLRNVCAARFQRVVRALGLKLVLRKPRTVGAAKGRVVRRIPLQDVTTRPFKIVYAR